MMELKFSDELQAQINAITKTEVPEDANSTTIKFDAKGTLHNRSYNSDGKLLKDVALRERTIEDSLGVGAIKVSDIQNELSKISERNTKSKILYYVILAALGILTIATVILIRTIGVMYGG